MLEAGWLEEARAVRDGPGFGPTAIQALGYREVLELADGRRTRAEVEEQIALFEGVARTANAVTRSRARLLGLERRDMIRLIEDLPGIAISLLEIQSRRVRELTDRLTI